jgi:hypothetical protein
MDPASIGNRRIRYHGCAMALEWWGYESVAEHEDRFSFMSPA